MTPQKIFSLPSGLINNGLLKQQNAKFLQKLKLPKGKTIYQIIMK